MNKNLNHMKGTLHINFFAGPGVGKSTLVMELTAYLKKIGYDADMTQEYAKELVYDKNYELLNDQLHIAGEQHRRMKRLDNNTEIAVHDSPFVMGLNYCDENHIAHLTFNSFMIEQYNRYNNLNILLLRNDDYEYRTEGRLQDKKGAIELDWNIQNFLQKNLIEFISLQNDESVINNVLKYIELYTKE